MARTYFQQGKARPRRLWWEDLVKRPDHPAAAHVLYARLLLCAGDVRGAVAEYKLALELDPDEAKKPDLAEQLGVTLQKRDVFQGRCPGSGQQALPLPPRQRSCRRSPFTTSAAWTAAKEEIGMKIIYPLQHPELYQAYGK